MKLTTTSGKPPGGGELHPACNEMLQQVLNLEGTPLSDYLEKAEWPPNAPKTELQRWMPALNKFDTYMEHALKEKDGRKIVDRVPEAKRLMQQIFRFSWMIYENTFSRSVYSSVDRLVEFLDSEDIVFVTKTLSFLLTISKRSRFGSQIQKDLKKQLGHRLIALIMCWDGSMSEISMNRVCDPDFSCKYFPINMTISDSTTYIITEPDYTVKTVAEMWSDIAEKGPIDDAEKHLIRTGVRMAYAMRNYEERLHVVIARLMAFSIMSYSRLEAPKVLHPLLKTTLIEDIGHMLHRHENFENPTFDKLKGEALRTLTSMVLVDKQSRLRSIVDATGANTYHGYVSVVTRICVDNLKANLIGKPGHMSSYFATALFSLLYHIAGNDAPANHRLTPRSAEFNLSSSIMDALLDVISSNTIAPENIGFLTRAIRVVDIITATENGNFNASGGIQAAVNRFVMEVNICKRWQETHMGADPCNHQRAALIKSVLNFLKQSVTDQHFADACRAIMDGDLPEAIIEVLENSQFYGASLFYNAISLVTSFIYQEPTKLVHLQNNGVCGAVINAIFRNETPINRDMISHLPSTLGALCLNERGLENVRNFRAFEKIVDIILSTKFMTISKKKKNGIAEFAPTLGNSLEELLRHQPSLRGELYKALANAIDRIREIAENTHNKLVYHCSTAIAIKNGEMELDENTNPASPEEPDPPRDNPFTSRTARLRGRRNLRNGVGNGGLSDDEDDDDDCNMDTATSETLASAASSCEYSEVIPSEGFAVGDVSVVPIGEYATYMVRVIETMVCPNINSDNARLFIDLGIVQKLIKLLCTRRACIEMHQNGLHINIANIIKTLLLNGYNTAVLEDVLDELNVVTSGCSKYDNEKNEVQVEDTYTGAFLISPKKELSKMVMEDVCSVGSVVQILVTLLKRPVMSSQSNDIRALLMKHFLNSQYGKPSMDNIAMWFRILTWELCAWETKMMESSEEKLDTKKVKKGREVLRDFTVPIVPLLCEPESVIITPEQTTYITMVAKIQKLIAEVQCTIVSSITDVTHKRYAEKMSSDCPNAFILIDESLKWIMKNLQWEGLLPAPRTRNIFRAAMVDFLRIMFMTEQTLSYFALITRFHVSGYYEVFCHSFKDLSSNLDSPGIIHLFEAWLSLTVLLNNCKHGKGRLVKIPKQQDYMFGCAKVNIKNFLHLFRSKTYDCIMSVYTAINEREGENAFSDNNARILSRCLTVYTDMFVGLLAFGKMGFYEQQKNEGPDVAVLAVTDEVADVAEMGFTDRQSNIAFRMFGRTEQAATFLSQYAGHENQPARLPTAEERRARKRKAHFEDPEKPKEGDTAAEEVTKSLLSNACDVVFQMYLRFAENHDFLLIGIAKFLDVIIQELDGQDQRQLVDQIFMQEINQLVDKAAQSQTTKEETTILEKLALRMRLLCLLWPKLPSSIAAHLITAKMVQQAMKLFRYLDFRKGTTPLFSKMMSLLILFIDLAEKTAVFEKRRKLYCDSVYRAQWKYWNYVNEGFGANEPNKSSWINFPKAISDTLDRRYRLGFECVKGLKLDNGIVSVNFTDMVVVFGEGIVSSEVPLAVEVSLNQSVDMKNILSQDYTSILDGEERKHVLDHCLKLLHYERVDADCVHALLCTIARLTKDFTLVPFFIEANGLENIFSLTCHKSVSLSPLYVTFIIRHCLDDEVMQAQSFEKIIKTALRENNVPNSGNYPGPGFAGRWYRPREGRTKDWLHIIHNLSPLGARDSLLFARVFDKITSKNNNTIELNEGTTYEDLAAQYGCYSYSDEVVRALLKFVLKNLCGDDEQKLINRSFLLRNLAELTKNYSCIAGSLVDCHEQQDVFSTVIKLVISSEDRNVSGAARAFLKTIAAATHSPRAQKALVTALQSCITTAAAQDSRRKAVEDIQELANLILQIRDACPANADVSHETIERQGNHNAIFWNIVESGILNDLVNSVWRIKQCDKEDTMALAASIIRTVEELSRHSTFLKKRDLGAQTAGSSTGVNEQRTHDVDAMSIDDDQDYLAPIIDPIRIADMDNFNFDMDNAEDTLEPIDVLGPIDGFPEPNYPPDNNHRNVQIGDRVVSDDDDDDEEEEEEDDDDELMEMEGTSHEREWYGEAMEDEDEEEGDGFGLDDLDDDPGDEEDMSQVDGLLEEVLEDMERESSGDYDHRLGGNVYIFDTVRMSRDEMMRNTGPRAGFANDFVNGSLGDMQALYGRSARADNTGGEFVSTANAGDGALPYINNSLYRRAYPHPRAADSHMHMGVEPRSISPEWLLSRTVFEPSGFNGFGRNRRTGPSLHRQNAVRRYPPAHMFTSSTLDEAFIDFRLRDGRDFMGESQVRRKFGMGASKPSVIPTALERYIDSSRIFDAKSVTYIFALVTAYYTAEASKMNSVDFWSISGEDRKQEAIEANERHRAEIEAQSNLSEVTAVPVDIEIYESDEENDVSATMPYTPFERVGATVYLLPPIRRVPLNDDRTTTVRPGYGEVWPRVSGLMDQPGPSGTSQNLNSELRGILGDLEIPDGVDPAFLAALPEDMRREVIRDHLRQQGRSQPSVSNAPVPVSNDNANEEGEDAPSNLPPPLDQEFLAALPPELQQELIEQHERDVRLAREAQNPPAAAPVEDPVDPAALLESLPPSLRAQVLADADDSVIQVLPQNFADEARRLRANLEQQQAMRYARMMNPVSQFPPTRRVPLNYDRTEYGNNSDTPTLNTVQFLNAEAISTVLLFLLLDDGRIQTLFPTNKLVKLIRNLCTHAPSCDYIIRSLTQFIQVFPMGGSGIDYVNYSGRNLTWLDMLTHDCGIGRNEKIVIFPEGYNTALINPRLIPTSAKYILEALQNIARAYPSHFLPQTMRSIKPKPDEVEPPNFDFFSVVKRMNELHDDSPKELLQIEYSAFSEAPIAALLDGLEHDWHLGGNVIHERLLRVCYLVFQKIPDNSTYDKSIEHLENSLRWAVKRITEQNCSVEAVNDGRSLLAESARAFGNEAKDAIFKLLMKAVESLGLYFLPELLSLNGELSKAETTEPSTQDGEMDEDTQSTAIKLSSMKLSGQKELLKALESIFAIRSSIRQMEKLKVKKVSSEAKKPRVAAEGANAEGASTSESKDGETEADGANTPKDEKALEDYVVLSNLDPLWDVLSSCLTKLEAFSGQRAVVTLQAATEAFFLVHTPSDLPNDLTDYLKKHSLLEPNLGKIHDFAEAHRRVLNQILRVSGSQLMEANGSFRVLMLFPKMLDFDVKRKFFRKEIHRRERDDRTFLRRDDVGIRVRRSHLFSDSFRELFRLRANDWKSRFYVVFESEEGQDAGGLLREWFSIITREIFNPNYALFTAAPGDRATYMINKASYINPEHLDYFKFVGKIIAKAIYENKLLDCYFTRAFYKHILNLPVRYQDIESEDPSYYKSLEFLLTNPVEHVADLTFSVDVDEFGVVSRRQLKEDGCRLTVTDENKDEYVQLVCQMKMTGSIRKQLDAFLEGFYEIIPKQLISIFNEQELELLISGLPTIDIDDLCANTEYKTYTKSSPQIQWFWRALRSFEREDLAKFLQFVTGTSKVPLQGFSSLEGMNGVQKFSIHCDFRSSDRLPAAHTCFNQLDLPQYESYEKLHRMLLLAIRECTEGFGFA
uniref:HECT-type E3 ubiquitin transferase n=1 Tax=Steinernema glaseri TaxID=37863 RepID=A0A1I8ACG6_9BILA